MMKRLVFVPLCSLFIAALMFSVLSFGFGILQSFNPITDNLVAGNRVLASSPAQTGLDVAVSANTPPTITAASNQTATVEMTKTFALGSFTDTQDAGPWTVMVDWDDASAETSFQMTTTGSIPDKQHRFNTTGIFTVSVTVDDGEAKDSAAFQLNVSDAPTATGGLLGTVYSDLNDNGQFDDGEGVAGATVALSETVAAASVNPVHTDNHGVYEFSDVPVGDYVLTVSSEGYDAPEPVDVNVEKDVVKKVRDIPVELSEPEPELVRMPFVQTKRTVYHQLEIGGEFNTMFDSLKAAELDEILQGEGPYTIFAPTDAAFDLLPAGAMESLLRDPTGYLTEILLFHVVEDEIHTADIIDGERELTMQGKEHGFEVHNGEIRVNGAKLVIRDIPASNGVVHGLDAVTLPPNN